VETAWTGDWKARVLERTRALGFENLEQLLAAREGRTFEELAKELGPLVAPIQVEMMYLSESYDSGRILESAAESLARVIIERFRRGRGWGTGVRLEYRTVSALVDWKVSMTRDTRQVELSEEQLDAITDALTKVVQPPQGWRPKNGQDPYIQRAFEIGLKESVREP
jgi:hypothetical protein